MKPEFLNLFRELCEEQDMLYVDPEGVKAKKKQRKIDFEVSDLRLKLANTMGKNVVLSNREIRLLRYENVLNTNLIIDYKTNGIDFKIVMINHYPIKFIGMSS